MVIEKVQNWMLHLIARWGSPAEGDKEGADSVTDGEVDNTHPGWNIIETLKTTQDKKKLTPTQAETLRHWKFQLFQVFNLKPTQAETLKH